MFPFKFLQTNPRRYKKYDTIPGCPVWVSQPVIICPYYYSDYPEYYYNNEVINFIFEQTTIDYFSVNSWEEFLFDNRHNHIWVYGVRISPQLSNYNTERLRGRNFRSSSEVPRSVPLYISGKIIVTE